MTHQALANKLRAAGIGPTPQRLHIAEVMLKAPRHLSADQVLSTINRGDASVSKATVYNTLRLFTERGLLSEIVVDPGRIFYDSRVAPHHHFYNPDTGELTDIPAADVKINGLPPAPEGTEAERVEVIVRLRRHPAG